jgi:hypothetical protein
MNDARTRHEFMTMAMASLATLVIAAIAYVFFSL